ncbi:8-oxo-dGTP diphosphatase [Diplonema papillatum]|nr:8-oxo-dGTP diphosphatase [Diplonema papillatum]|eukprot:gene17367-26685_t
MAKEWDMFVPKDTPGKMQVPFRMKVKVLTLVTMVREGVGGLEVLLGHKARGFGKGKWNGFGGKVEAGETIEEGARRELMEEAGIAAVNLRKRAVMYFWFDEEEEHLMEVHLFSGTDFTGDVTESEEMTPIAWFPVGSIPLDKMWPDDRFWLRHVIESPGFLYVAKFRFANLSVLKDHEMCPVSEEMLLQFRQK